jgi:hypothetical protein
MTMLRRCVKHPDVIGLVMVVEGWVVEQKPGVDLGDVVPSRHPDRREALLVTVQWSEGRHCLMQFFRHGEGGEIVMEESLADEAATRWSGNLLSAYDDIN